MRYSIHNFTNDRIDELLRCPGVRIDKDKLIADIPFMATGLLLSISGIENLIELDKCVEVINKSSFREEPVFSNGSAGKLQTQSEIINDNPSTKSNNEQQLSEGLLHNYFSYFGKNEINTIKLVLNMFDGKVVGFTGNMREFYEERAAIIEFDGGFKRVEAEAEALKFILNCIS